MQIILRDIRLGADSVDGDAVAIGIKKIRETLGSGSFGKVCVYRRSVDARHRSKVQKVYSLSAEILGGEVSESDLVRLNAAVAESGELNIVYGKEKAVFRPLVVGFGPAGMFCALLLAENGYRPIVIERGRDIPERNRAVELFRTKGILDTENNVQFGAGGAGTFSDGKLVTRINDKKCRHVLETYHRFGAPDSILTEAKPHIGTDNLGKIVTAVREHIEACGGEVHFNTRFEGYSNTADGIGVATTRGVYMCSCLILATGHSARDTYKKLADTRLNMLPKPFSVGVRVEQLQREINRSVYGKYAPFLGNAEYNFSYRKGERAVYTFCMCPGGKVVEAASEEGTVVVNGMSNYARDGVNSNAALVVSVLPEDCGSGLFDGMNFQRQLEKKAFVMGGSNYSAPIQTVGDYLNGKRGTAPSRIRPTYMDGKGCNLCDLNELFPKFVNGFLKEGLVRFENNVKGYAPADGVLTGAETRTSSPLRILRTDMLFSQGDENIFPCGEGAGYAGGITSASVDGVRVALKIMERYRPFD